MAKRALSNCRSCGAQIRFIQTANGKNHPINAAVQSFWVETDGEWSIVKGHTSHFATCPNASAHRTRS